MSQANPRWGAPRIHGELLKLGIDLSRATVAKYMVRRRNPASQTWRTFLANHVGHSRRQHQSFRQERSFRRLRDILARAVAATAHVPGLAVRDPVATETPRHSAIVRATHWVTTLAFFALLVSGVEILLSHPRFYWGETGSVLTPPLFTLPLPSSRASVPTGYGFVLRDQNGWSRSLHFQGAWLVVFTGCLYWISGLITSHFRKNLLPAGADADLSRRSLARAIVGHLRFERPAAAEAWSYNVLQRLAYLGVIFVLFPLIIWTGLAMSPAFVSAFPIAVTAFGGQQSARTIHFFVTVLLVLFLIVHVVMVCRAGFVSRMRAMITGHAERKESAWAASRAEN